MTRAMWILTAFLCATISHASTTDNRQYIDTANIQEQISTFMLNQLSKANISDEGLEITPHKISKTLKLPDCTQALNFTRESSNRSFFGRNTIKVSCATPRWSFYSGITIKAFGEVITAALPIGKGEIITDEHLKLSRIDRSKINGNSLISSKEILGMAAKRPIRQGKLLNKHQFEQPKLISRGDGVIIKAVGKSMTVSTPGQALNNGRLGENIRVKNLKSDREVIAKVKDRDTVVVMLY